MPECAEKGPKAAAVESPRVARTKTLIAGLDGLTGHPDIKVAVLDGPVDATHACFQGARLDSLPGLCSSEEAPDSLVAHGTHVASLLFGQPGTAIEGLCPQCSGVLIPVFCDGRGRLPQHELARGLEQAAEAGVHVVNLSGGQWSDCAAADPLLQKALDHCLNAGILIVAAAGNDGCECHHVPAALRGSLAVGALDEHGRPAPFSNYGKLYAEQGIMAPGVDIEGAVPGGTHRMSGTSFATPLVSGVAALLLSQQVHQGQKPDPSAVRQILLDTVGPCSSESQGRCLAGRLDAGAARRQVEVMQPAGIAPSAQASSRVYALGTLGYDFGSEARRDSFKQLMSSNPYDARQMVDYLAARPSESEALIWTLSLELTPIYAVAAVGPFASDVYALLRELLAGQVETESSPDYVERVSLPGEWRGRRVRLFSGQWVPLVEVAYTRGLYGWKTVQLVAAALRAVGHEGAAADLRQFLDRVYYDLRNLGMTSQHRALNFAATNAFQAAHTFSQALAEGLQLENISLERSPYNRIDSDCWDVKLKFFDPDNSRRARRVFRFTIDVSDILPVTLGEVRSWASPD